MEEPMEQPNLFELPRIEQAMHRAVTDRRPPVVGDWVTTDFLPRQAARPRRVLRTRLDRCESGRMVLLSGLPDWMDSHWITGYVEPPGG